MIDELRLDTSDPSPSMADDIKNINRYLRKTSSSYPSQGHASTRVQSPESMLRPNKLSFTDLSRFGKANDRLSNLRSTLSSDGGYDKTMSTAPPEAMEEAITAIAQWQGQLGQELHHTTSTSCQRASKSSLVTLPRSNRALLEYTSCLLLRLRRKAREGHLGKC